MMTVLTVHADHGFLGFHGFLKLGRKSFDTGLQEIALVEVQNGREQFLQLVGCQIRRALCPQT